MNKEKIIYKTNLTLQGRILLVVLSGAAIAIYALLLKILGGRTPGLDSLTTVLSVAAMIMTVKRCIEQWVLWTIVNLASIVMWFQLYLAKGESFATLAMGCIALANGIIFYIQWTKEAKIKNE